MSDPTSTLERIITILNDCQFHDGSTIGKDLGMTRAGVWKIIQKLGSYGIKVHSLKGKGYVLPEPLVLLDKKKILAGLNSHIPLEIFETIPSTHTYAQSQYSRKELRICMAEHQTSGRGRLERKWCAPFAQSINISLVYPFTCDVSQLAGLSLTVGLAVCSTINNTYQLPHPVMVKWPNDITYQDAKLAGILIDVQAEAHGFCSAVIGIGINVNMLDDGRAIDQSWTSIRRINNQCNDRNILSSRLINDLLTYLRHFEQQGFEYFIEEWKSKDSLMSKVVDLKSGENKQTGKVVGVSNQGHLLLELEGGHIKAFSSGDTTVCKMRRL